MSGELARLAITHETTTEFKIDSKPPIYALFNPNELTYTKKLNWRTPKTAISKTEAEVQKLEFTSSELETLAVSLFFDTYGGVDAAVDDLLGAEPAPAGESPSVLTYTAKIVALSRFVAELHRPPICELKWGKVTIFRGVLESLTQKITLFLSDGTPVRATLDCQFKQFQTKDDRLTAELHSPDVVKRYTVLPGDTLAGIAQTMYGNPLLWRPIAVANRIDDPRRLSPGRVLSIPKLR